MKIVAQEVRDYANRGGISELAALKQGMQGQGGRVRQERRRDLSQAVTIGQEYGN
jgi:hypothetical protein